MLDFILFVYELITFHNMDKVYAAANNGEWYVAGSLFCISLFYLFSFVMALWVYVFGPVGEFLFDARSAFPLSITGCGGDEVCGCIFGSLACFVILPLMAAAIWPIIAIVATVFLVIGTILIPLREIIRLIRRTNHASGET